MSEDLAAKLAGLRRDLVRIRTQITDTERLITGAERSSAAAERRGDTAGMKAQDAQITLWSRRVSDLEKLRDRIEKDIVAVQRKQRRV